MKGMVRVGNAYVKRRDAASDAKLLRDAGVKSAIVHRQEDLRGGPYAAWDPWAIYVSENEAEEARERLR